MVNNNILVYKDQLLPISETFIKTQSEGLRNYNVYYVGSRKVEGLQLPKENVLVINSEQTVNERLRESLFKSIGWAPNLVKYAKKINPVLIHAHFGYGGVLALPLMNRLKIPLLVTFHGLDATLKDEFAYKSSFTQRLYLKKRNILQNKASTFIAVSNFIRKKLIEQGFPEEKIITHYIGIDAESFKPNPTIKRENIILFVGRLVEVKGCEYLIRAMEIVQANDQECKLVIIGDGPLRKKLEVCAEKKLKNYAFLGAQSQDEIRTWLNKAKIFCVPSISLENGIEEAFGIVFAEAAAMGVPVVSFNTGGIPEVVADGETGFLTPQKNFEELAVGIRLILNDQTLWFRFSTNARMRISTKFNLKLQNCLLEEIYNKTLETTIKGGHGA